MTAMALASWCAAVGAPPAHGNAGAKPPAAPVSPAPASEPAGVLPLPFPHPLITEVLYAVPAGPAGDADGDGARSATGDEFVELVNPYDRPINLRHYTLHDLKPDGQPGALKFTFPDCTLPPGGVAVVFNGFESQNHGGTQPNPANAPTTPAATPPAGGTTKGQPAPADGAARFHGAKVFSMHVKSARVALANAGDVLVLSEPGGRAIHTIRWGKAQGQIDGAFNEVAPLVSNGSVTRRTLSGPLVEHEPLAGLRFSPGLFPPQAGAAQPAEPSGQPAPAEPPAKGPTGNGGKKPPAVKKPGG